MVTIFSGLYALHLLHGARQRHHPCCWAWASGGLDSGIQFGFTCLQWDAGKLPRQLNCLLLAADSAVLRVQDVDGPASVDVVVCCLVALRDFLSLCRMSINNHSGSLTVFSFLDIVMLLPEDSEYVAASLYCAPTGAGVCSVAFTVPESRTDTLICCVPGAFGEPSDVCGSQVRTDGT